MPTLEENLDRLDQRDRGARAEPIRVRVVNLDIPFLQIVWLMIKFAIAAIPAAVILGALVAIVTTVFGGLLGGYLGGLFGGWRWI